MRALITRGTRSYHILLPAQFSPFPRHFGTPKPTKSTLFILCWFSVYLLSPNEPSVEFTWIIDFGKLFFFFFTLLSVWLSPCMHTRRTHEVYYLDYSVSVNWKGNSICEIRHYACVSGMKRSHFVVVVRCSLLTMCEFSFIYSNMSRYFKMLLHSVFVK